MCSDFVPVNADAAPVRVYTMGRFALVKDGVPITFSGKKSPRKALELLQALIALGGRDVHLSHLMSAVWSDIESNDQRKLFDNTVHRLRKLLGCSDAIVLGGTKLSLNHETCWVDAWAFQRQAGAALAGGHPSDQAALTAIGLYQGSFLFGELELPWLISYRLRLHSLFLRLVLNHGQRLEAAGLWRAAADTYELAIEKDNLVERLYQRLMACNLALGEHAEALRTYRRCRQVLSVVFGVQPSLETERIRVLSRDRGLAGTGFDDGYRSGFGVQPDGGLD